jgi:type I restriction enzyme M protein
VGIPDEEDDGIPFEEKMNNLTATLACQIEKEKKLDEQLKNQLAKVGFAL